MRKMHDPELDYQGGSRRDDFRGGYEAQAEIAEKQEVELEKLLKEIFNVLDIYLGDSDPCLEEDITDEELKDEEPLIWCCIQIRKALKE